MKLLAANTWNVLMVLLTLNRGVLFRGREMQYLFETSHSQAFNQGCVTNNPSSPQLLTPGVAVSPWLWSQLALCSTRSRVLSGL